MKTKVVESLIDKDHSDTEIDSGEDGFEVDVDPVDDLIEHMTEDRIRRASISADGFAI